MTRVNFFMDLFENLESTTSMNDKLALVATIPSEYQDDWQCILSILAGKVKLGYTYYIIPNTGDKIADNMTIRDIYEFLQEPYKQGDLSLNNIINYIRQTSHLSFFLEPLVNRKLRLGIGQSLIPKDGLYPMLGKRYEGVITFSKNGYFITEKLDGNRCIAHYEDNHWVFTSRNGKKMNVDFYMGDLPTDRVYDGEILSTPQTELSKMLYNVITTDITSIYPGEAVAAMRTDFNKTSGVINSKYKNKELVYNIFDIIEDTMPYYKRRELLNKLEPNSVDVRILPVLITFHTAIRLTNLLPALLDKVVACGGEGVMINIGDATYQHKRTPALLKYKKAQTMDMIVHSVYEGTSKYQGMAGGIRCLCKMEMSGCIVDVNVGTGLSDDERVKWFNDPKSIIGKVVEIEYFALSQNADTKGTKLLSLTFPRFKRVRDDKTTTSEY